MANKNTIEMDAKNRKGKLQAAALLISNAIHALETLDDMSETTEQLCSAYNEIKDAGELEEDSPSKSVKLDRAPQLNWLERITAECPVVERWKSISA